MAEQTEINKRLQYSILEYIKSQVAGSDEDTAESLNVALDCLSSCFGLSLQDTQQAQLYSVKPATLEAIFSVGHRQVVSAIQSAKAAHVSQKTSEAAPFEVCRSTLWTMILALLSISLSASSVARLKASIPVHF
eukprot:TRINITY_DN533_c0_g2_i7.p1 TRINITY_DN533_c0_g2~~TRINITY_DN533_c0_g2_i7.p1  ORF type:complete len:134 (-),score=32.64 TRINITY_DN533_c0_g2_i7:86-487(-)